MTKKLLFTLFIVLIHTFGFGATKTYLGSGNWNTAANWSPAGIPTSSDDVIISSGKTVAITENAEAKSISLSGSLTINDAKLLTVGSNSVWGDFTVNSGGSFTMGSGSDLATLVVYGNYINNGITNFWKSDVVIIGDLLSPATSELQKQGNVVVGGNIIGDFKITGSEVGVIYAVNPNATVTIIPASIDSNVTPGTQVPATPSNTALSALVNAVIYGSDCPFTITGTTSISGCVGGTALFTASTSGSSPSYQWEVNMGSGWSDLVNNTVYSGVNTSNLAVSNITAGMNNYKFRARITASGCTEKGNYGFLTVSPSPTFTTQPVNQLDCEESIVTFKVVAGGTGTLTYIWQRKRPSDASFTAIPVETNVSYPNPGEIRLQNVGSSLSPNGTQYQVVVSNGTCSVTSIAAQLSVNEITDITSPSLTPSQSVMDVTLCYGTNYSYSAAISNPSNGPVSYQWKSQTVSGSWNNVVDGAHFSGCTTATLNIINGTPAESAKYRVDIVYSRTGGNCSVSSFSKIRLLTFLPLMLFPAIVITQPTCSTPTGVINVTVQSATDTYSFDNGANYQVSNVKSGLVGGTYKVIIKNIGGCVSSVTNCVIAGSVVATWNGSAWSPSTPTSIDKIIFNGSYFSSGDVSGCSCQVTSGTVTIASGNTMALTNEVTVSGGSLTLENNASLVQINENAINTGNITYKRITTPIRKFDYTYWSSPVVGYALGGVSPNTSLFYSFDAVVNNWKQESAATVMSKGIGYIVRGPQNYDSVTAADFPAVFVGVPNNGAFSLTGISADKLYLIGNPYPSALDADKFLTDNSSVLDGTLYFWTHNTAIQLATNITNGSAGSGTYAYTSDDYASYNLTGGVGTTAISGGTVPSGKIASGQAFFTSSKLAPTGSSVVFNNTMRVGVGGITGDNSQFFKMTKSSKTISAIEKHRIWLNLTNTQGAFKQMLVGYVSNATNGYDNAFDGESFDGNQFVDFYSVNQDKNLTIQGRALPFDEKDEVPLGYTSTIEGAFSIAIDQVDGLLVSQDIFIEDKNTNVINNLKQGAYNFSTEAGTFNDRFVLRYINTITNKTLVTGDFETLDNTVLVSNKNKQIKINSSVEAINKVQVYDLSGKSVYQKINVYTNELTISNLVINYQALLVKIVLQNGKTVTKKIVN
ncbi:T9SS sorting signal type C domain-containing protein [Flavobacterium sp. ZB4R12]|uniref:T9SS sorting signal type C domain-containing protein n=1 Tax=Flavobacterium sp. ZB4R12 TaxID=3398732 RepID=UPI003AAE45D9